MKENKVDGGKDWWKEKSEGKGVKEVMGKVKKERDKVGGEYGEKESGNEKKVVKMKKGCEDEKKGKKEGKGKEKKEKGSWGRRGSK